MFRPFEIGDIEFDTEPSPPPKLIKKPKSRKKLKSWYSYYRWWLSQQYWEIWYGVDASMPYKRVNF